ncbi:MAG: hypothetical protein WDN72_10110 [Alphaproteobacteria bacterium]
MARRDKDQPPRTFPRWLSWWCCCSSAYILYEGNFVAPHREQRSTAPGVAAPGARLPAAAHRHRRRRWKRALNPDYVSDVKMHDIAEGDGEGARCGEEINHRPARHDERGRRLRSPRTRTTRRSPFRLGAAPVPGARQCAAGPEAPAASAASTPAAARLQGRPAQNFRTRSCSKSSAPTIRPRCRGTGCSCNGATTSPGGPGRRRAARPSISCSSSGTDKGEWAFDPPKGSHRIKLGEGGLETYALDAALVGLAKGGTRTIVLPPMSDKDRAPTDAVWKPWHDVLAAHRVTVVTVVRTKEADEPAADEAPSPKN